MRGHEHSPTLEPLHLPPLQLQQVAITAALLPRANPPLPLPHHHRHPDTSLTDKLTRPSPPPSALSQGPLLAYCRHVPHSPPHCRPSRCERAACARCCALAPHRATCGPARQPHTGAGECEWAPADGRRAFGHALADLSLPKHLINHPSRILSLLSPTPHARPLSTLQRAATLSTSRVMRFPDDADDAFAWQVRCFLCVYSPIQATPSHFVPPPPPPPP